MAQDYGGTRKLSAVFLEMNKNNMAKKMKMENKNSQIVIYKDQNGDIKIDVRFDGDTVWLTQKLMAELFNINVPAISKHLNNIYEEGELQKEATVSILEIVQEENGRKVKRKVEFYNLDAIIAVGYRVNSKRATQFRIWATKTLKEYIVKGFVIDSERLKNPDLPFDYVVIAKNYYNKEELTQLNALVGQYLIFATEQARRRVPMTMDDWIEKLHGFLTINDRNILQDAGRISHELMKEIAEKKFEDYKQVEAKQDVDFDEAALKAIESVKGRNKKIKIVKNRITF